MNNPTFLPALLATVLIATSGIAYANNKRDLESQQETNEIRNVSAYDYPELTKRTKEVEPRYPAMPRSRCMDGEVVVRYTITHEGKPTDIEIVRSEPKDYFDDITIKAVKKWRFKPPKVEGEPVNVVGMGNLITFKFDDCFQTGSNIKRR